MKPPRSGKRWDGKVAKEQKPLGRYLAASLRSLRARRVLAQRLPPAAKVRRLRGFRDVTNVVLARF